MRAVGCTWGGGFKSDDRICGYLRTQGGVNLSPIIACLVLGAMLFNPHNNPINYQIWAFFNFLLCLCFLEDVATRVNELFSFPRAKGCPSHGAFRAKIREMPSQWEPGGQSSTGAQCLPLLAKLPLSRYSPHFSTHHTDPQGKDGGVAQNNAEVKAHLVQIRKEMGGKHSILEHWHSSFLKQRLSLFNFFLVFSSPTLNVHQALLPRFV